MLKGKIRPVVFDDAHMVLEWRNQDFVRNNMYNNEVIELESHLAWFKKMLDDSSCLYFIYEQEGVPLGLLSFSAIDKKNNKASWAFYSSRENLRGVGSEMEQIALDYAFNSLRLNKLCCEVLDFNYSVVNFHRKHGFRIEGIRRKDYYRDGQYFDIYQLALFRDDYLRTQNSEHLSLPKNYMEEWEVTGEQEQVINTLQSQLSQIVDMQFIPNAPKSELHFYFTKDLVVGETYTIKTHLKSQTFESVVLAFELFDDSNNQVAYVEFEVKKS